MSEFKTRASIAPLQSAITVASDGGARIKIDIPETEWQKYAMDLMSLRNCEFELTWRRVKRARRIEPVEEYDD